MVTRRAGHSIAELIVTVTFLGVGLTGVAASSLLGARWTSDGLRRQEAIRGTSAVLDSLVAADAVGRDSVEWDGLRVRWEAGPRVIAVTAETLEGVVLFELRGRRTPRVPVLPDEGADEGADGGAGDGAAGSREAAW